MAGEGIKLGVCAKTDRGPSREGNEDSFYVSVREGIFVVADGMGGHMAGAVASSFAVQLIGVRLSEKLGAELARRTPEEVQGAIEAAVEDANKAIYSKGATEASMRGMGTTCVAVVFAGDGFVVGHVGDSRAYLFRDGQVSQLTVDHSLLSEAAQQVNYPEHELQFSYLRNVITRAVGPETRVEVESHIHKARDKDLVVLCTDGLSGFLDRNEIAEIILRGKEPGAICNRLVQEAKERGSDDNITAVVVSVTAEKKPRRRKGSARPKGVL